MIWHAVNWMAAAVDEVARWWMRWRRPPCHRCGHAWEPHVGDWAGDFCTVPSEGGYVCGCDRYEFGP